MLFAALAPALALTSGLATTLTPGLAHAGKKVDKAACQVHAVLAKHDGDGTIPADLEFMKEELSSPAFAAFKSFRLLGTTKLQLKLGETTQAKLASGHAFGLRLLDGDHERLKLHAKLGSLSGERSLLDADYTIKSDGFLLLAAAHTEGSVIVAVQCHGKGKAKKSG
jgi:hypothetical protein